MAIGKETRAVGLKIFPEDEDITDIRYEIDSDDAGRFVIWWFADPRLDVAELDEDKYAEICGKILEMGEWDCYGDY